MKALILGDEINQFHWSMLKSVLLVLSMLPISQGIVHLWQSTEGSSQIMVAFFAISLMSSLLALCFWSALNASVIRIQAEQSSAFEQTLVNLYRHVPMLSLASMLCYSQTTLLFIQDSKKTRNNSSTESINHSLRLRLTHAHMCSIGFKSGLYAGSQRILCPCCSNNS